jgi:predicted dehydrogenase
MNPQSDCPSIKIAVIGLGHWGPNHIRVFNSLPGCLVSETKCFRDATALLREADAGAVVVCTPTSTHYPLVKAALESGRHVLCEKPLCIDPAEADELAALARARGLVLMVGHVFLFNSGLLKVKELVDAGEVGSVRYLSAVRTNLGPIRSDVNAAYDLASHDISIFNWILGADPVEVRAMGAAFLQPGVEDVVVITMRYPGSVLASIQCSWLDPKKLRQITLVGSRRMVTWDDLALSNPVAIYEKAVETNLEATSYGEFLRLSMLDGDVRLPKVAAEEPLKRQAREFLAAIAEGRAPASDGAFGARVVRVLARVAAALRPTG